MTETTDLRTLAGLEGLRALLVNCPRIPNPEPELTENETDPVDKS